MNRFPRAGKIVLRDLCKIKDVITWSASAITVDGYPLDNIKNDKPYLKTRIEKGFLPGNLLTIVGHPQNGRFDTITIEGHNLSPTATIKVYVISDQAYGVGQNYIHSYDVSLAKEFEKSMASVNENRYYDQVSLYNSGDLRTRCVTINLPHTYTASVPTNHTISDQRVVLQIQDSSSEITNSTIQYPDYYEITRMRVGYGWRPELPPGFVYNNYLRDMNVGYRNEGRPLRLYERDLLPPINTSARKGGRVTYDNLTKDDAEYLDDSTGFFSGNSVYFEPEPDEFHKGSFKGQPYYMSVIEPPTEQPSGLYRASYSMEGVLHNAF